MGVGLASRSSQNLLDIHNTRAIQASRVERQTFETLGARPDARARSGAGKRPVGGRIWLRKEEDAKSARTHA
jgi:hypothetical protein